MTQAKFNFFPRGSRWAVYEWENKEHTRAKYITDYPTRDEAKTEVYRLNGWKLKK